MTTKTLSIISVVLTVISLILLGIVAFLFTVLALNGYGEREGNAAIAISLICQGSGLILSAILASRLTRLFIEKFNWNKVLAVILSILAGTTLGVISAFGSFLLSIIAADTLWNSRF
ncbi:MAG: hypothetical protein JNM02_08330 [Anaerolineales bacterium]|nr:hypothetical protein [Anaerolineales bacterium]